MTLEEQGRPKTPHSSDSRRHETVSGPTTPTPESPPVSSGLPGGFREVAALATPLVLSQILITAMGVVDSAIVGRLGAAELGAVGLSGMWVWTLSSFFVGASTSVQTFVAQEHGAGRSAACGNWCWQGMSAAMPLAAIAATLVFFGAESIIHLLAPSDTVTPLAADYMRARAPGMIGITAAVSLSSFFRGVGDARTPLLATIIANVANLGLDLGLVYGWFGFPRLGVFGAGLATSISEWIYLLIVAVAFLRPAVAQEFVTRWRRPDFTALRRLWRVGLPIGGQWITEMLAFSVFTTFVARMGDAQLAANHAFIQLLSLAFMQAEGLSMAAATLVGRYIGAERPDLVARTYRSSALLAVLIGGFVGALFLLIPEILVGVFTTDPRVLALSHGLLAIGAGYALFDSLCIVTDGALRGAGDTLWPFATRSLVAWFVLLPGAYLFAFPLGGGLTGAWTGGLFSMGFLVILLTARFRSGAWGRIRI